MIKLINTISILSILLLSACQHGGGSSIFPSTSPRISLAQSIQDALIRSGDPVVAQISVQPQQNNVILKGYVKKIRQSDIADQIARQIAGNQNVQNDIIVRP